GWVSSAYGQNQPARAAAATRTSTTGVRSLAMTNGGGPRIPAPIGAGYRAGAAMHPIPIAVLLVVTGFAAHTVRRALDETTLSAPPVDSRNAGTAADPAAAVTALVPASSPTDVAAGS